jgi:hypothetical protein
MSMTAPPASVGDTAVVTLNAADLQELAALQFSLDWNPAKLKYLGAENAELPGLRSENFGTHRTADGVLTFAWTSPNGKVWEPQPQEEVSLLRLKFLVHQNRPTISLGSAPTPALAYDGSLNRMTVGSEDLTVDPLGPDQTSVQLSPTRPNPASDNAKMDYVLPERTPVEIQVFNALGQAVATLESGEQAAGTYRIDVNAGEFPSGVYIIRLKTPDATRTQKMTVVQ